MATKKTTKTATYKSLSSAINAPFINARKRLSAAKAPTPAEKKRIEAEHAPAKKTNPSKKAEAKLKNKAAAKPKKLSALDAAAQLLAGSGEPMGCKALVEAMAAKGLWTSPGGKTPHATLYSAILREIATKGKDARFKKTDRGQFAAS